MTRLTVLALALVLALATTGCTSSTSLIEARDHLDATYTPGETPGTWTAAALPAVVADALDINLRASDTVLESGNHYLRGKDWLAVVSPTADGTSSLIELDDYDSGYNRHSTFIGGYWGSRPDSYGPRSSRGGSGGGGFSGVRGGGSGGGK